MERDEMIGNNRIEDIRWLCSLSESELDLLISIKKMAIQRAFKIGHGFLADKFDLKMLRDLSHVLMDVLKEKLEYIPELCVDKSNLAKHETSEEFREMGVEELMEYIGSDKKKRISEVFDGDDFVTGKKRNRFESTMAID